MKKLLNLLFLPIALPTVLCAQPANDECSGVIHLGIAPECPGTLAFSNVDATASGTDTGSIPSCFNGGNEERDVWFSFTSSDTIFDYTITVAGISSGADPAIINPQVALYRGDCSPNGMAELACASAAPGSDEVELDIEGLTANTTYFLRVNDYTSTLAPNWGAFQLCIEEKLSGNNITEGSSTACSGVLYDSGGPDGDYSNYENHTFTICPDEPHGCILFTLDYFFIEPHDMYGLTDRLAFYDGAQAIPGNIIGEVGSFFFQDDGGGGVCYQVRASSGCLTVRFTSDYQVTFEGFRGRWECTYDCETVQPITVEGDISSQQVIDVVSTPATTAAITSIDCPSISYGIFQAPDPAELGLGQGLLLTTGRLSWAAGPNSDPGSNLGESDNGASGDPDLDYLSQLYGNGMSSENACIVELDVFANTNELAFEYIFGSEEYQEYVGQEFNDIFAFLISGPGIIGDPNLNNQRNIAVLPNGSETPVQINSVNHLNNWEYYRNNNYGITTQYDGLTSDFMGVKKSLTARAQVEPCNTYHLKLAIADRADPFYDSGVFISELRGGTPQLSASFNSGIDYLVENCISTPDELTAFLPAPSADTLSYLLQIGGTASRNIDYVLDAPDTIVFLPGETSLSFPITALSDQEAEPTEVISIRLVNDFGCGEAVYSELQINLADELRVEINAGQDTAFLCPNNTIQLYASGAGSYFWSPPGIFNDPASSNPVAEPESDQWVTVEGVLGPCVAYDSIFLRRISPTLEVETNSPTVICRGDSVRLVANNNVAGTGLQWGPSAGLNNPTGESIVASPLESTTYFATIDLGGCILRDSVFIDVAVFDFPVIANDTTICENYGVRLAGMIPPDSTTTLFQWTPSSGLNSNTIAGPLAFPETSTTYRLIGTAANGACADTAEVTITVLPADLSINSPDTIAICRGATVSLSASTTSGTAEGLSWSPDDGSLSDTSGLDVTATPQVSTWYFATQQQGPCPVADSVFIYVAGPPLYLLNEITFLCPGDSLALNLAADSISTYTWTSTGPAFGTVSDPQPVVRPSSTTTYYLSADNGLCPPVEDSITIEVGSAGNLQVGGPETTVCAGDSIRLYAIVTGSTAQGQFLWQGSDGSSQSGPEAVFTPGEPVTYTLRYISGDGCDTITATLNVEVAPATSVSLETDHPDPENASQGGAVTLTALANLPSPLNFTWTLNQELIQQGTGLSDYADTLITNPSVFTVFVEAPQSGCRDSASIIFRVAPPAVEVPSAFTPNGDGHNDRFTFVMNGNIRSVQLFRVFNRWGQMVFENEISAPDAFTGWDGTFKGKPQPSEVYFYTIRLERYDGEMVVRQGEVSLLR